MADTAPVLPDTEPSLANKQTTEVSRDIIRDFVERDNCVQAVPATVPESEGDESEEDESEILEESPCGRWLKRREEVSYRDVPGIDCAYLAMDTEEGVEVSVVEEWGE